jgi:hypothetical protein
MAFLVSFYLVFGFFGVTTSGIGISPPTRNPDGSTSELLMGDLRKKRSDKWPRFLHEIVGK